MLRPPLPPNPHAPGHSQRPCPKPLLRRGEEGAWVSRVTLSSSLKGTSAASLLATFSPRRGDPRPGHPQAWGRTLRQRQEHACVSRSHRSADTAAQTAPLGPAGLAGPCGPHPAPQPAQRCHPAPRPGSRPPEQQRRQDGGQCWHRERRGEVSLGWGPETGTLAEHRIPPLCGYPVLKAGPPPSHLCRGAPRTQALEHG